MNVGIVGGGALGLGAAWEFTLRGHRAAVFERAPFVGGQASTFEVGGGRLEQAYHHLFTSDGAILGLAEEVGLGHRIRWLDSRVGMFSQGRVWDFVTPMDLLRFKPLPVIDRLRLGLATLYLRRYRDWRRLEGTSAAQWIRRFAGPRAYEVVWGPLLRGKFGRYEERVGMPWFWGKIHTRFASREGRLGGEKLGYPAGSFGEIFDTVAERIRQRGGEVHTSAGVSEVLVSDGTAVGLEVELPGEGRLERGFDMVLATVPSYVFPRLVPSLPQEYRSTLGEVSYLAAVLIVLVLDRPLTGVYWLNIADRSVPFVGLVEHTNLVEPELYGGNHIVYLSNYLARDEPMFQMGASELLEEYLPHLGRISPGFDRSWIRDWHYHCEPAAQPVVEVDYSRRIPRFETPVRRLYLANTTQIYPEDRGTNYSVKLGREMAGKMLNERND